MHRLALLSALSVLGACQLAPPHERPTLPTAEQFPVEYNTTAVGEIHAANISWREFIADPQFEALIEQALASNRDLAIAIARIEEARGAYGIQRADRLPTATLNGNGTRSQTSSAVSGSDAVTTGSYSLAVGVSAFELDFWGRVANLSAAARGNYLASIEATRAFQLALTRNVAAAYLQMLEANERISLAERTVRARSEQIRIAKRRLEAGVTSELEFRQAETLLTQAEAELAALRLSRAQSRNLLEVLVGKPLDAATPAAAPLGQQLSADVLTSGLPSELLETRPDVRGAEERLIAARANIGAARAAFFPSISLTGSTGFASKDLDELTGSNGRAWSFGPSINLPIFDSGRRRGNLDVAKARESVAIADYERVIQTAFREVADALAGRRYLAEQVAAQERGIVAQRRLTELAHIRYNEGVVRYLEVLDAERNLFSAEQAMLQIRRVATANDISLYIALGGGELTND